jgi:hypothetical protein
MITKVAYQMKYLPTPFPKTHSKHFTSHSQLAHQLRQLHPPTHSHVQTKQAKQSLPQSWAAMAQVQAKSPSVYLPLHKDPHQLEAMIKPM